MAGMKKTPNQLIEEMRSFQASHFWARDVNAMIGDAADMIEILDKMVDRLQREMEDPILCFEHDEGPTDIVVEEVKESEDGLWARIAIGTRAEDPEEDKTDDPVNHPAHYCGKIETIDFIRDKLPPAGFAGYCAGNVLKYISRYDKKNDPVEDLQKAAVYLGWLIEAIKEMEEGGERDG